MTTESDIRSILAPAYSYYRNSVKLKEDSEKTFEEGLIRFYNTDAFQAYIQNQNMLIPTSTQDPLVVLRALDGVGKANGWSAQETLSNVGLEVRNHLGTEQKIERYETTTQFEGLPLPEAIDLPIYKTVPSDLIDDYDTFSGAWNQFTSQASATYPYPQYRKGIPSKGAVEIGAGDTLVQGYENFNQELGFFRDAQIATYYRQSGLSDPSGETAQEALKYVIGDLAPPEVTELISTRVKEGNKSKALESVAKIYEGKISNAYKEFGIVPTGDISDIRRVDAQIAAQEKEAERQAIMDIDVDAISKSLAGTGVADLVGADDSALVAQKQIEEQAQQKEYEDLEGFVGMFGGEASPAGLGADDTDPPPGPSGLSGPSGSSGPSAADLIAQSKANEDEVYALLQEQFGGASYFFRNNALDMKIGVTADGTIVSYDDESRERTIPLMQYIVDNGITSLSRVKGLLQKTEWWQTTDVARRTYDVMWGEMSDPERVEFLDPTTDALTKEAQFLGFDLDGDVAFTLAQTLAQNGDSEDVEAIREMIIGQLAYNEITNEFSDFSAGRDALEQLAYKYYVPQTEEAAQDWAEKIYTGEATQTEYEQMLKATAVSKFPTLDKVINEMGITPDQYFSPYKYQIEQMLGRQVDMLDEFSDVIEYIPDTGTTSRPMTLSEVQNFVRALPEWQQTDDAKDRARALAFSIGQTFGEVA